MKRIAMVVLLALCCGGCFGSDASLYQGVKPLTPLHPGPVTSRDKDGKIGKFELSQDADDIYRLTVRDRGEDFGKGYRVRFFPLAGAPEDMLVAEVKDCGTNFQQCGSDSGWSYELVRLMSGKVEWRDPDCSTALSKLSGLHVQLDSCKFADRASLEKALQVVAQMPWQATGSYVLAGAAP
jgi:hypothetical protein